MVAAALEPDEDDRPTLPSCRGVTIEMQSSSIGKIATGFSVSEFWFSCLIALAVGLIAGGLLFGCAPEKPPAEPTVKCSPNVYETRCL